VIAVPSGGDAGGDLSACFFRCSDNVARVVLADCSDKGTGEPGGAAQFITFAQVSTTFAIRLSLLAALNDEFSLALQTTAKNCCSTVVTGYV